MPGPRVCTEFVRRCAFLSFFGWPAGRVGKGPWFQTLKMGVRERHETERNLRADYTRTGGRGREAEQREKAVRRVPYGSEI